jgi:hypothetical protein
MWFEVPITDILLCDKSNICSLTKLFKLYIFEISLCGNDSSTRHEQKLRELDSCRIPWFGMFILLITSRSYSPAFFFMRSSVNDIFLDYNIANLFDWSDLIG